MYACHSRPATIKCNTSCKNDCSQHTFQFVGHSTKKHSPRRRYKPSALNLPPPKQTNLRWRWWWRWRWWCHIPLPWVRPSSNQRKVAVVSFAFAFCSSLFARQIKNSAQDWGTDDCDDLSAMPKVVRGCWSVSTCLDFTSNGKKCSQSASSKGAVHSKTEKGKLKLSVYLHKIPAKAKTQICWLGGSSLKPARCVCLSGRLRWFFKGKTKYPRKSLKINI